MIALLIALFLQPVFADQLIWTDVIASSTAWNSPAYINYNSGFRATTTNPQYWYSISIASQNGTPYASTGYLQVCSGPPAGVNCAGSSVKFSTTTVVSVNANFQQQWVMVTVPSTTPSGYYEIDIYAMGGKIFGSCTAGTNIGGTYRSCSPVTDGAPFIQFGSTPPATSTPFSTTTTPMELWSAVATTSGKFINNMFPAVEQFIGWTGAVIAAVIIGGGMIWLGKRLR